MISLQPGYVIDDCNKVGGIIKINVEVVAVLILLAVMAKLLK